MKRAEKTQPFRPAPVASGLLQRKCACGGASGLAGECKECSEEKQKLMRSEKGAARGSIPPVVHEVLSSPGEPLEESTRASMESRFGHDFSHVRVHTDSRAAESADAVNAFAYTVGHNIVFADGKFSPSTSSGRQLIAHELTHVVQQSRAGASGGGDLVVEPPHTQMEQQAKQAAAMQDGPGTFDDSQISPAPVSIQRTAKWQYGTVSQELNLAERFTTATNQHAGQTLFMLNGTAFAPGINIATARSALNRPTIKSTPRADRGVDCSFDTLPHNEGTYDTKTIDNGKWQFQTTKKRLAELFPKLKACKKAGGGDSILTIQDNPDVTKNTRLHEEQHAIDDKATFETLVAPWDNRLTQAKQNNQTMAGVDAPDCETKLYSLATRQQPAALIQSIIDDIGARATTFHRSAAGQNVTIYDVVEGTDCNAVRAKAK